MPPPAKLQPTTHPYNQQARYINDAIVAMWNSWLRRTGRWPPPHIFITPLPPLHPSDIPTIFQSPPIELQRAIAIASAGGGNPLQAIQHLTTALNLRTTLSGEKKTILCFNDAPLKGSLCVTEGTTSSIWMHKDTFSTAQGFSVASEADLKSIAESLLAYKAELESDRGELRAVPRTDPVLLGILREQRWDSERLVPRFAEAQRAVAWGNVLDATVALLTPFVLWPREKEGKMVLVDILPRMFLREQQCCINLLVERLDRYIPTPPPSSDTSSDSSSASSRNSDSTYYGHEGEVDGVDVRSSIIVHGLPLYGSAITISDIERQAIHMLQGRSFNAELTITKDVPKGLIYDLSSHFDVVAFVSRILDARREARELYSMAFAQWCATYGWDLGYERRVRTVSENGVRVFGCRARKSGLRNEITVEELLGVHAKREEARLWMNKEIARKAAKLERDERVMESMRSGPCVRQGEVAG